ncbi:MAG: hypothetical protein JWM59_4328, partial [Verrucomicrobiales bacterium]|nr:hypothetical protein [Verrucomicrobiales bacterium]
MFARSLLFSALLMASAVIPCSAQDAVPLYNGRDLSGWTNAVGKPVTAGSGWAVEADGVLHRTGKGGNLFTDKEYGDFELTWDWKIAKAGNSGVKYRVREYPGKGFLGCEYQMLDDVNHPDGKIGAKRQTASLYDILPPAADKKLSPPGEWNTSKIVVKGTHIEHWLNGAKVLEVDVSSDTFKTARAASKFKDAAGFAENTKGRLMLQDHGDETWFRNI